MSNAFERAATVVVAVAVVLIAAVVVHREFGPAPSQDTSQSAEPPMYVASWEAGKAAATMFGDSTAPVLILEFADLQCPGCRAYQPVLRRVVEEFRSKVAVGFVHFPIPSHMYEIPVARGAECSKSSGKFHEYIDAVYVHQRGLPSRTAWDFARGVGVGDSITFARCVADSARIDPVIRAGYSIGQRLGVDATPTIIVNGWKFDYPPGEDELVAFIRDELAGRHVQRPVSATK